MEERMDNEGKLGGLGFRVYFVDVWDSGRSRKYGFVTSDDGLQLSRVLSLAFRCMKPSSLAGLFLSSL